MVCHWYLYVDPTVVTVAENIEAETAFCCASRISQDISTSCIINWSIPTSMKSVVLGQSRNTYYGLNEKSVFLLLSLGRLMQRLMHNYL